MGKPTPKAPQNTGTPPLILRMPVNADEKQQEADKSVVKNFTAQISVVNMHLMQPLSNSFEIATQVTR